MTAELGSYTSLPGFPGLSCFSGSLCGLCDLRGETIRFMPWMREERFGYVCMEFGGVRKALRSPRCRSAGLEDGAGHANRIAVRLDRVIEVLSVASPQRDRHRNAGVTTRP
jgi:hypothetical protein